MSRRKSRLGKGHRTDASGKSVGRRFLMLEFWMLDSEAFRHLDGNAVKVLLHMWRRYNTVNNGSIGYGVRDASDPMKGLGISKSTAARALEALEAAGFVEITVNSTFRQTRLTREWRLTWLPTGSLEKPIPATKEFMTYGLTADEKRKLVPPVGLDSPARGTKGVKQGRSEATTVPPVGLSGAQTGLPQSRPWDTSISHQGGSAAPAPGMDRGAAVATSAEPDRSSAGRDETTPALPAPASRRRASTEPERCASTVDVEAFIASSTSAPPPVDLRQCYSEWIARQPRGTEGKVGFIIGVSRPQLANFRGRRFDLSVGAAEKLARVIERDSIEATEASR